ncbi:MAG: anti-sigma factor antagonist [Candidatus Poribacteria bacterium]|nr:anti-sigma factor antagonist [Candidatus Poribacteria bacterium]
MEISIRIRDNVAILDIRGEIIGDARFDLNIAIQEQVDSDVDGLIINLDEVPMMDSVGLGMLVAAYTSLTKKEKKVVLLNVGRSVRYLLVVTKLDQIFEKYDDEDEAVESFKK